MQEKDNILKAVFLDGDRVRRTQFFEVIFCQGKELSHLSEIFEQLIQKGENIFGTRCDDATAAALQKNFPALHYDPISRTLKQFQKSPPPMKGSVAILAAGTSDAPVAEEAYQTLLAYGLEARRFYDVGVAGLHRLVSQLEEIKKNDVVIAVAGMEGALPSVLGGLVDMPIIACPTSVGYGTHLGGLTTLAAMLNSCSEGISVVNIDNGFGAACAALRILRKISS